MRVKHYFSQIGLKNQGRFTSELVNLISCSVFEINRKSNTNINICLEL